MRIDDRGNSRASIDPPESLFASIQAEIFERNLPQCFRGRLSVLLAATRDDSGRLRGMESGESGSWSTPLPYLSICEAIFSAVRRLSLVFYKVVTKVALIFTLVASSWQSARQENIVPSVLSEPASRSTSKRSQPTRAGPLARRGRAWMRTQEISYSQSEEFTVPEIRASATHARARGTLAHPRHASRL